jgi:hypothetical protein
VDVVPAPVAAPPAAGIDVLLLVTVSVAEAALPSLQSMSGL